MADLGAVLKSACDSALGNPAFRPEYKSGILLKTHCNQGARAIAQAMGCHDFDDLAATADIIYAIMSLNGSGRWARSSGADATIHALGGGLAFASLPSDRLKEPHGHIAAIYPVGMQYSGSLAKDVPMCANIGARDWLGNTPNQPIKVSMAFPVVLGEPDYFIWK